MAFLDRAMEEIRSVPGVAAVATTDDLPLGGGGQGYFFSLEEKPETRQQRSGDIQYVSPGYFETLRATILRGRPILPDDNRGGAPRVMVVNEALVNVLFGAENPLGRRLHVNNQAWEIVGVVADMRLDSLHLPPRPTFYVAHWHFPWGSSFLVRTEGEPKAAAQSVAAAIHRLDPNLPLANLQTLDQAMQESLGPQKIILNLISAFAATALLLASVGLYGVMSYVVVSRQRELSIRSALGAARVDIIRLIVGRGGRLIAIGLGAGLLAALAAARLLASRLQAVDGNDPSVFAGAALLLIAVGLAACWLPARRATKADPVNALRGE